MVQPPTHTSTVSWADFKPLSWACLLLLFILQYLLHAAIMQMNENYSASIMIGICFVFLGLLRNVFPFVMVALCSSRGVTAGRGGWKRERESVSLVWHLGGPHCRSATQGPWTSGQARQLPGSPLGYGSGPPTRSHVTPSVPPCPVPSPALPSTTQHCQTGLRAGQEAQLWVLMQTHCWSDVTLPLHK